MNDVVGMWLASVALVERWRESERRDREQLVRGELAPVEARPAPARRRWIDLIGIGARFRPGRRGSMLRPVQDRGPECCDCPCEG